MYFLCIFYRRWLTAILSTLFLLATLSLLVAGILSLKVLMYRMKIAVQERQRKQRINRIPTISFSSKLIMNKNEIQLCIPPNNDEEENNNKDEENKEIKTLIDTPLINETDNKLSKGQSVHNETCNVCLEDFIEGEDIKLLQCNHGFHDECIRKWIVQKGKCPVCIRPVF